MYHWLGILPGIIVTLSAAGVNTALRRQASSGKTMDSWSAWLGSVTVRILGFLASAVIILVGAKRYNLAQTEVKAAYLWLLGVVLAGMLLDMILSIGYLKARQKVK